MPSTINMQIAISQFKI